MKRFTFAVLSLALVLLGLIGVIVCVTPSSSAQYKLIQKYVAAVNKADSKGMQECCADTEDLLGISNSDIASDDDREASVTDRMTALKTSLLSISSYLPEDAKEVESLKVIGCSEASPFETDAFSSASEVTAIIQMTFIDADGETAMVSHQENFVIAKTANGLKLM